jgi:hypothetical protein
LTLTAPLELPTRNAVIISVPAFSFTLYVEALSAIAPDWAV